MCVCVGSERMCALTATDCGFDSLSGAARDIDQSKGFVAIQMDTRGMCERTLCARGVCVWREGGPLTFGGWLLRGESWWGFLKV